MVAAIARLCLPAGLAITRRSRKFYDGTYQWNADGFTDEHGVYREYDCYNPEARAPTPLPPMFSDDSLEMRIDQTETEAATEANKAHSMIATRSVRYIDDVMSYPEPTHVTADEPDPRTPEDLGGFALAFTANLKQSHHARQNTPSVDMEDTDTASKLAVTGSVVDKSHEQAQDRSPTRDSTSSMKMLDTPPDSPAKTRSSVQTTSPSSATSSALSPVPSNLSDPDTGLEIQGASTAARRNTGFPNTLSKSTWRTTGKAATTRGVAQKVTKGPKKTKTLSNQSSTPKRKENSVEEFTLRELHSMAFMRKGGLRRSVRQAKSEGK